MVVVEGIVTWQQAEDALTAAVEYLFLLPDRERGYLMAGSRTAWPQVIRSVRDGDYGDGQGFGGDASAPSPQLTRRMVALVETMLTGERAAAKAVPEGQRRLVGRVIVMKRWPGADEFGWPRVWDAEGGRSCGVTSDALRMRYERAIGRLARRMTALGMAVSEDSAA